MNVNRKTTLISATAAWCIGQYAGPRRKGSGCDAALGFDFMHFLMSISRSGRVVVIEYTNNFLWRVEPNRNTRSVKVSHRKKIFLLSTTLIESLL